MRWACLNAPTDQKRNHRENQEKGIKENSYKKRREREKMIHDGANRDRVLFARRKKIEN